MSHLTWRPKMQLARVVSELPCLPETGRYPETVTRTTRSPRRLRPATGRIVIAVVGLATAAVAPARSNAQGPDFKAFDLYIAHAARDWRVPGLAIAVVKGDSLVFAKGYGVIQTGKPAPVTEHTRFAIGSTTKAMTVAALAMLADEGKLHWDDKVIDYVPGFRLYDPYVTRELTIRDLLTHRTGLPGTDLLWAVPENQYSVPEMIRRLRYVKPVSSFRSQWEYENVMYAIAGTIVERASGESWESFIRTRIFIPLGMKESETLVSEIVGKPNVAVPHALVSDTVRVVPVRSTDAIAPAGSVWASVSDMSRWMRFILDSGRVGTTRLIQPATFREIVAPQIRVPMDEYPALQLAQPHFFSYALGWFVQDYHGQTVWMHTGSIDGMCAIIGLIPEQRLGVYVLENLDHAELRHALMYRVFDMYSTTDRPIRDWSADLHALFAARKQAAQAVTAAKAAKRVVGTRPSMPLEQYAGTYTDSTYGNLVVTLTGGMLHALLENANLGALAHWEYDSFRSQPTDVEDGPATVTFQPDGAGHVRAVRVFGVDFQRGQPTRQTPG
jgi:CubicO group peptidase (beta-lactamase class C family)